MKLRYVFICKDRSKVYEDYDLFVYLYRYMDNDMLHSVCRECHRLPWGFPEQPVPVPMEAHTCSHGCRFSQVPVVIDCFTEVPTIILMVIGMELGYMGHKISFFLSIQQNPVLITAGAVRIIGADYTS